MYVTSYDEDNERVVFSVFSREPEQNTIELITRDFDLGEPSIRKKIYRVWVTYKSNFAEGTATGAFLYHSVDATDNYSPSWLDADGTYGDTSGRLKGTGGVWKRAWFKPPVGLTKNV